MIRAYHCDLSHKSRARSPSFFTANIALTANYKRFYQRFWTSMVDSVQDSRATYQNDLAYFTGARILVDGYLWVVECSSQQGDKHLASATVAYLGCVKSKRTPKKAIMLSRKYLNTSFTKAEMTINDKLTTVICISSFEKPLLHISYFSCEGTMYVS